MSSREDVGAMIEALNDANEETLNMETFYQVKGEYMHDNFGFSRRIGSKPPKHVSESFFDDTYYNDIEIWNREDGVFEGAELYESSERQISGYVDIFFNEFVRQDFEILVENGRISFNSKGELCYLSLSNLYIQVLPESLGKIKVVRQDDDEDGWVDLSGNLLTDLPDSFLKGFELDGNLYLNDNLLKIPDGFTNVKVTGKVYLTTSANINLKDFDGTWEPEEEEEDPLEKY